MQRSKDDRWPNCPRRRAVVRAHASPGSQNGPTIGHDPAK
jgi:hypothetical protein